MDRTRPREEQGDGEQGLSQTPGRPIIVVENLEWWPTRWLLAEYEESYKVARSAGLRFVVTGAENPVLWASLSARGVPAVPWRGYRLDSPYCILLDLEAEKPLEPWEAATSNCIVVGGIMGDHPPQGRTRILYGIYRYAARRHLGSGQFSVDGAVKMAAMIASGLRLNDIPVVDGVEIDVETPMGTLTVELPYRYPVKGGKPWIAEGVRRLLARGIVYDEEIYGLP